MFLGHGHSVGQEFLQVAVAVGHVHGGSAQDVGGTDQAGVFHSLTELDSRLEEGKTKEKKVTGPILYPFQSFIFLYFFISLYFL